MTATVADEHLIALVAGGDPDAVGGLYNRHAGVLLAVAFRILGSRADAEDIVHDAFASLPDRSRHYAVERGSVAAWLIILVRNLCLDRLRRRGVRAALVRESPQVLHPPPAGDPGARRRHRTPGRARARCARIVAARAAEHASNGLFRGPQLLGDCGSRGNLSRDRQVSSGARSRGITRGSGRRGRPAISRLTTSFRHVALRVLVRRHARMGG